MPQRLYRRQFIKHSRNALIGLSAVNLCDLGNNYLLADEYNNQTPTEKQLADLEKQIPQLMRKAVIPGISIVIVKDGELLWSKGFGVKNRRNKEPVTTETVFAAASLSKPVFAYAVLKMCERGELDLDTPLTEYTDKPLINDRRIKLITARMVLSHTSGLPNFIGEYR